MKMITITVSPIKTRKDTIDWTVNTLLQRYFNINRKFYERKRKIFILDCEGNFENVKDMIIIIYNFIVFIITCNICLNGWNTYVAPASTVYSSLLLDTSGVQLLNMLNSLSYTKSAASVLPLSISALLNISLLTSYLSSTSKDSTCFDSKCNCYWLFTCVRSRRSTLSSFIAHITVRNLSLPTYSSELTEQWWFAKVGRLVQREKLSVIPS